MRQFKQPYSTNQLISLVQDHLKLVLLPIFLLVFMLASTNPALAALRVPTIPSNSQFATQFEHNSEYIFRVKQGNSYLETGALIAYVDGKIRGGQTASIKFPGTGLNVYKVRIYSNVSEGETVTFKYYDVFGERIFDISETISFEADEVPDFNDPKTLNAICGDVTVVTGMIPADTLTNLNSTLDFYWQPATNATSYSLYLWKEGENIPTTPYRANISASTTRAHNLSFGTTYFWKIHAINQCNNIEGPTQQFSVRTLPDLNVVQVIAPDNVESATPFNIQFTVQNDGEGSSTDVKWYDGVYISSDNTYDGSDTYLGRLQNPSTLIKGEQYTQNMDVTLPVGYTGNYFILVRTDMYNHIAELDNNNNTNASGQLAVDLKPLPDLAVKNIIPQKKQVLPGDSITISWDVENNGNTSAVGGWSEKVTLTTLAGLKLQLGTTQAYTDSLSVGSKITRSVKFKIPTVTGYTGDVNIRVELLPSALILEHDNAKANNIQVSNETLNIGNLLSISVPSTSIKENFTGTLRCYVTRSGNTTSPLQVALKTSKENQITVPATVTIPAGNASQLFLLSAVDNTLLDGPRDVTITGSAAGFNDTSVVISVQDNEVITLDGSLAKSTITEGDSTTLTITRDLVTADALTVKVTTNKSSQITIPNEAIIPGGEASTSIVIKATQNDIPESMGTAIVTLSAAGYHPGNDTLTILDDDVPQIEFDILADTVSESAGPYATWGVIRRTGDLSKAISVRLSANVPNAFYFPATVSLPANARERQFNIGVVDNDLVDGFHRASLTAAIYLSSCNCTAGTESGGAVTREVVIADNDGPTLSLTIDPISLAEGRENAGTITIRRNTSTVLPMNVNLAHDDPTEITLPKTATIPAGESFVTVPVTTLNDGIEDPNQMVTITASAPAFSPGIVWVFVTDVNKPDLIMSNVNLETDSAIATRQVEVKGTIVNNGYAAAPSGVVVKMYLSKDTRIDDADDMVGEHELQQIIAVGESVDFWELATMPAKTGTFNLLVEVNPDAKITELLHINNTANPQSIRLYPNYNGTAEVEEESFLEALPVDITGKAIYLDGSVAANMDLDVYILSSGTRREIEVKTDDEGNYETTFTPNPNESGFYEVGACYPKQNLIVAQDEFNILGMERASAGYFIWDLKLDVPKIDKITMRNKSKVPLTNLNVSLIDPPEGIELEMDTIKVLPGLGTADFNYIIKGTSLTDGLDYVQFTMRISSDEGIEYDVTVYYYCQALQSNLKSIPASINTSMTKGKSRIYELKVYNNGAGETGNVSVLLPSVEWMSLVSPDTMPSIPSGDTAIITLQLTPGEDLPLNAPFKGKIAINVPNGKGMSIPYRIESVSEETGSLLVDVIDEYTYYTAEAPHVKDAHVVIRHPYSGKILAEGFTGEDGLFKVDSLQEGSYTIVVQADKHEGYQNTVVIDPGRENQLDVFLSFQAITYTWEVVPTEIEDEYEVVLVLEYETNVPVPVVIVEMPKVMPQLFNDETYPFVATITNKGLITALDVEINFPQDDPEYEFVTNFKKLDLLAQQAIQVPVVMRRRDAFANKSQDLNLKSANIVRDVEGRTAVNALQATGNCTDYVFTVYGWECGKNKQWQQSSNGITFSGRICPGSGGGGGGGGGSCCGGGGWGGPSRGGGGSNGPGNYNPAAITPITGCDNCLIDLALAALGCIPGASNIWGIISCAKGLADGSVDWADATGCASIFFPPGLGCATGLLLTARTCYNDPPNLLGPGPLNAAPFMKSAKADKPNMPPILKQALQDMVYVVYRDSAEINFFNEYMGNLDWRNKESFQDFGQFTNDAINHKRIFTSEEIAEIKKGMDGLDITPEEIDAFVNRWNTTVTAWDAGITSPNATYPNIVDQSKLNQYIEQSDSAYRYAKSRGYSSVNEMNTEAYATAKDQIEGGRKSVCASVTIEIKQKLTMTREAFEGTLTIFNGNTTTAMKEIEIFLEVRNENNEIANELFEIETKALDILTGIDGTGQLGPEEKGSATILFIPERGAAPEVPQSYSFGGSFSYLDPFTGTKVTKPLFPVTLDVHPSPDLFLHYFMQRDIYGDDPLTAPIEPIIPGELAVMIENNGFGAAKNVKIESAQPEIVDNEKGLAIHFELVGSNLQGQPKQMGLIDIDFGTIDPKSTRIGQWWFTADLLGHFVNYEASVTHVDSRGNPDLSLVSGAELHELMKSIRIYGDGATDDGISDFLVNEVQDAQEIPDVIYDSQGNLVHDVYPAIYGSFTGSIRAPEYKNKLTVKNNRIGWNFVRLPDPSRGFFELVSVTRDFDGQEIPLDNAWQTHVTLPDGKDPVYENNFHFVDLLEDAGEYAYTIVWKAKAALPVSIVQIDGIPEGMLVEPLKKLTVEFNKSIDPATFTYEDMLLRLQGGDDIMDTTVVITAISPTVYELDISALTTGNGYYVLTVQTAEIEDENGAKGKTGKQATWTQFLSVPAVEEFVGLPSNNTGLPFDFMLVNFNLPIDVSTLTKERFIFSKNGETMSVDIVITQMDVEGKLFQLSGLKDIMNEDAMYKLTVDLLNIASTEGEKGIQQQSVEWSIDTTPPEILAINGAVDGGLDEQHRTTFDVIFSEAVSGFDLTQVKLWHNELRQPLSQVHLDSILADQYLLSQFRLLTYYEGVYTLTIDLSAVSDAAGNKGVGTKTITWTIDRVPPPLVENLRVSPDLGYDDRDGVTSTRKLDAIMDVMEDNTTLEVYQDDNGTKTLLASKTEVMKGELTLPITATFGGNMMLEAHCIDAFGNSSIATLPLYIDEVTLAANFIGVPQTVVEEHPDSIIIEFSDSLLEEDIDAKLLTLSHKGASISLGDVSMEKRSKVEYLLTGLKKISNNGGIYNFGIDLSNVHKYSSGISGTTSSTSWILKDVNLAPVADAGPDFDIIQGHTHRLNGTGSYDANGDVLLYQWYAPDGITLDDPNSPTPTFTAPMDTLGTEYTFILSISDGLLSHTDRLTAIMTFGVNVSSTHEATPLRLYPNPAKTHVMVDAGDKVIQHIRVYDMAGKQLITTNGAGNEKVQMDLAGIAPGIYTLKVHVNNEVILRKIVIQ